MSTTTLTTKTAERSYEYEETSLDESEALDRYAVEKARNPGSIVTIEELNCGEHYRVKVYKTEREKRIFQHRKIRELFDNLWDAIKT